jgi:hypothetical protein
MSGAGGVVMYTLGWMEGWLISDALASCRARIVLAASGCRIVVELRSVRASLLAWAVRVEVQYIEGSGGVRERNMVVHWRRSDV